jgi:hypothetical protein
LPTHFTASVNSSLLSGLVDTLLMSDDDDDIATPQPPPSLQALLQQTFRDPTTTTKLLVHSKLSSLQRFLFGKNWEKRSKNREKNQTNWLQKR